MTFEKLHTISIATRASKVNTAHFARAYVPGDGLKGLLAGLPRILAGEEFLHLVAAIRRARNLGKPVLWGLGGHVVKCGLAPVLIDLMRRGFASGFLMNGSTAIHDFEIAIAGQTSEDVADVLPGGQFGVAEETGRMMNEAIREASAEGIGIGEALGRSLQQASKPEFAAYSLLHSAWQAKTPVTVHVAIGTDTPHIHPAAEGSAIGAATYTDFRLVCQQITQLNEGGVYLNVGSAVILPEVFLKAVSVVRNLGHPLHDFTTANFDFLQHYRPRVNVVQRPHVQAGGQGIALTGHHEILVPLLAAALVEGETD